MEVARILSLARWLTAAIVSVVLTACGGGGSAPTEGPGPPNPFSYSTPQTFTVGVAITALAPSGEANTGSGTISYEVSPALPAGLTLDRSTGVISGTPTVVAAKADYTVGASFGKGGSTYSVISITVAEAGSNVAPNVSYPGGANYTYTVGDPGPAAIPSNSGGPAASWSITPAPPAGLTFNTANGSLTGKPTAISDPTQYQVTAQNPGGTSTQTIVVRVQSGLLLELGHDAPVRLMRMTATRAASQDGNGHWVLWNYGTGDIVAHDRSACAGTCIGSFLPIDLAGNALVVGTPTGFDVYSATDGTVLTEITASLSWWKLANDGSYIAGGNNSGLYVWSTQGRQLLVKSGDYHQANIFPTPGEIRVGLGAAGANVIETVAVPSGTSAVSPSFQGTFTTWFGDGERFLSSLGTTVWTYSRAAVQQDITTVPQTLGMGGQGNWFWATTADASPTLNIYQVGNSAGPTSTFNLGSSGQLAVAGAQLAILQQPNQNSLSIINLSGANPTKEDYTLPLGQPAPLAQPVSFAAQSAAQWAVGMAQGVILDGASFKRDPNARFLGLGKVLAVAGSPSRFLVAMQSGKVLQFDPNTSAAGNTLNISTSLLSLSADGSVAAVAADRGGGEIWVETLSMPFGQITGIWPYTLPVVPLNTILSSSGTALGQVIRTDTGYRRRVSAVTGGAEIFTDTPAGSVLPKGPPLWLSPNGNLFALSGDPAVGASTQIYNGGVLSTAVQGWAAGWLDDARLLVNNYTAPTMNNPTTYSGASIYGPTGTLLGTSPITELRQLQVVDADHVYTPDSNTIFTVSTGVTNWTSRNPFSSGLGAVAGPKVVFVSDTVVRAEVH